MPDFSIYALSADDYQRAFLALEVLRGHPVPTIYWPPLHFWIVALALKITGSLLGAPLLVNVAASFVIGWTLFDLSRTLRISLPLSLFLAALLGTPYFILLGISGLAEPTYCAFLLLSYRGIAFWQRGSFHGIWQAAFFLLLASAVRFDAWSHAVIFSALLVYETARGRVPRIHAAAAVVPFLFLAVWMLYNFQKTGHALYFLESNRSYFFLVAGTFPPVVLLAGQVGIYLTAALPLWPILAPVLRRFQTHSHLFTIWWMSLALMIVAAANGNLPLHNPTRIAIPHVLLLIPFAVRHLAEKPGFDFKGRLSIGLLTLSILVQTAFPLFLKFPSGIDPRVSTAAVAMRTIYNAAPGKLIMEKLNSNAWALRALSGHPYRCEVVERTVLESPEIGPLLHRADVDFLLLFERGIRVPRDIRLDLLYDIDGLKIFRVVRSRP